MKSKNYYFLGLILTIVAILFSQLNLKIYSLSITLFFIGLIGIATIRKNYFFLILLSLFWFFPQMNRYDLLPIMEGKIAIAILAVLLFSLVSNLELKNSYNSIWLFFLVYFVFQIGRGIALGYKSQYIFDESIKYLYYPIGFYFTLNVFKPNRANNDLIKQLLKFILIMGFVIFLQMIYYYFFITHTDRVITRQANLLLLSLMTSLTLLIFKKNNSIFQKSILMTLSLTYVIGIVIFMQRSLWLATFVSLFVLVLIFLFKSGKGIATRIIIILMILSFSGSSILMFNTIVKSNKILEARTTELDEEGLETFSIAVRILSYLEILNKVKDDLIIGLGVGDEVETPYLNKPVINVVDNSYIVILWKLGIIGILIFIAIFVIFIYQMTYLINNGSDEYKIISIIFISNIFGQFVNGLACVILVLYHLNIIWVSQIAIINSIYFYQKKSDDKLVQN